MDKKVEELVEWVAKIIDKAIMADMVDGRLGAITYAEQILSHPDLALIDREKREPVFFTHSMLAIRESMLETSGDRTIINSHSFGLKVVELVRNKYRKEGFTNSVIPLAEAMKVSDEK